MSVSAHQVAAVLRARLPELPVKKLHKLLYYCQGHHLATFGKPLFRETISAWDMGPVVGHLWWEEKQGEAPGPSAVNLDIGEAALNTIGYVLNRYGALTGRDLEHLTHAEAPWRRANQQRQPGGRTTIELDWISDYFRDAAGDDNEGVPLDSTEVREWLAGARTRSFDAAIPDKPSDIMARLNADA
jgi:uncharacterized phage-associated protein